MDSTSFITDVAASFDLHQREAAVYVAALTSGAQTVQAIALAASTERTGTYDVLERLSSRGLLRLEKTGKRAKVILEPPTSVRNSLQAKLAEVDAVLPRLTALFEATVDNFSAKREVGEAVLNRVFELVSVGVEPLRLIVGTNSLADGSSKQRAKIDALTPLLLVRKTKVLASAALSQNGQTWVEHLSGILPCRRLPSPTFFASTQIIFSSSVVTISFEDEELLGLEVTSPLLVQHEQSMFDTLWRTAK